MPLLFLLYSMCFGLTFMFWHPHLLVSFICGCQFYILQTGNRLLSTKLSDIPPVFSIIIHGKINSNPTAGNFMCLMWTTVPPGSTR